jgi:hypothetical protein
MKPLSTLLLLAMPFAFACSSDTETLEPLPTTMALSPAPFDPASEYAPSVVGSDLETLVDNPFFPAPVGARWVYEATTDEGVERIEVEVLGETRPTWGVLATVVRDTVHLDGALIEDTWDWYSEDADGNVWYLGEDTYEYEDGEVVCSCGAWEAGVNQALPGVVMLGEPRVGDVYRQEYLRGEAEDLATVISVAESVTVPAGSWTGCLKTRDRSAIDPELDELKYYCPNVGNVLVEEGDTRVELIEYSGL